MKTNLELAKAVLTINDMYIADLAGQEHATDEYVELVGFVQNSNTFAHQLLANPLEVSAENNEKFESEEYLESK